MKRITSLLLALIMILSLFSGCSSEKAEGPEVESAVPIVQEESPEQEEAPEIQLVLEEDWVPGQIRENLDQTIRWEEMLEMLTNIITLCNASGLESWNAVVRSNNGKMERDDGMLAIYEAACVLGIGHEARTSWLEYTGHYNAHRVWETNYSPNETVFTNVREVAPYEDNPGHLAGWDYLISAQFYSLGQSSAANAEPFFAPVQGDIGFNSPLTRREAITAAAKLKQAYEVTKLGGFRVEATNWDDPLLADAKAARDAILHSPTTITKGEQFVLGETYTGNAYYVSNAGNDNRNGLSPETAWATLSKVEKANLQYGDAVFFERGGVWQGHLFMQYGVTYSAYGEGEKPIITGSPLDAAQPEKWTLYSETADGGKIWKYAEETEDCGVILLNGGEIVARKSYPIWNGSEYTNRDAETYIMEEELYDLMFFSAVDLHGVAIGEMIEGNGMKGPLYLRCDAGNPGEVYSKIEMSVTSSGTTTAEKGWNAIDNIHFRCYAVTGMDCNCHDHIVYQNCETAWCGGGLKSYPPSIYKDGQLKALISGGGMLLFGSNVTARNNYIHDIENKGIAVVINGSSGDGHRSLERVNVLAEGNVVEHCGNSLYMMVEYLSPDDEWKVEDIRFVGNFIVNVGYGWRQKNQMELEEKGESAVMMNNVLATGEVLLENNVFYRATGTLIYVQGKDLQNEAIMPTFRNNTYVQDRDQVLFAKVDDQVDRYPETTLATSDQSLMEKCVQEYMGDTTGKVIVCQPAAPLLGF